MKKILTLCAVLSLLFLFGCSLIVRVDPKDPEAKEPTVSVVPAAPANTPEDSSLGLTGEVTQIEYLDDGAARILVEGPAQNGYDKAYVTVKAEVISDPEGKRPNGLLIGDRVEVVFGGPVAESYPVQAGAKSVVIAQYKDISGGSSGPAGAYYIVMQQLFEEDPALNDSIEMIVLDLEKADLPRYDRFELLTMAQSFGIEVKEDSFEGLQEKGLIKDLYFENGLLFRFAKLEGTEDTLRIEASKWRSGTGAIGANYTVEKKNGSFTVTKTEGAWIS